MTRDEKLVILTELVKENAITLEEAFGLAEDCEIEIGELEDDEEGEKREEDEEEKECNTVLNQLLSDLEEMAKRNKIMTFSEWLADKEKKESKK